MIDVRIPAGFSIGARLFAQALVIDLTNSRFTHLTNVWADAVR